MVYRLSDIEQYTFDLLDDKLTSNTYIGSFPQEFNNNIFTVIMSPNIRQKNTHANGNILIYIFAKDEAGFKNVSVLGNLETKFNELIENQTDSKRMLTIASNWGVAEESKGFHGIVYELNVLSL